MHPSNAHPNLQQDQLQHQVGGADQFLISKERLADHTDLLHQYGGIENIVSALKTNIDTGITGDDLDHRRKVFGSNFSLRRQERPPPQTLKCCKRLLLDALRDTTIILLLCCALLSLVIEIKMDGLAEAAIDGALIFLAVSFVVTFGAIFRFLKARWMMRKSLKSKVVIWVVRNGNLHQIPDSELVVGDIVCLHAGDHVPADGVFVDGDSFQSNEECSEKNFSNDYSKNPSLFTGSLVVKGHCRMLVTSVGENTERSRLTRLIGIPKNVQHDEKLPLLDAIDKNNSKLEKIWLSLSLILLSVQLVRCFVMNPVQGDKDRNPDPKGVKNTMEDLMNESIKLMKKERSKASDLATMLCVLLFASRDGLPLAIFTSLLYASKKMKSYEAVIQKLPSSATIGLVTTICTGKTTDLVLHHAKMAELWVGFNRVDDLQSQVNCSEILDILRRGIIIHDSGGDLLEEISLRAWARVILGVNIEFHGACSTVRYEAPDKEISCSIIEGDDTNSSRSNNSNGENKVLHVHWKGEPEIILSMCSYYYTVDGTIETLDDNKRKDFLQLVQHLHACCRRRFAFAYKRESDEEEEQGGGIKTHRNRLEKSLTLIGFIGLKNPYSLEAREAIEDCRKTGVRIKLMVDDDINTARIMGVDSGILRPEVDHGTGSIIESSDFRTISEQDRINMIEDIHVLANASPADKLLMVQTLKQKGEVVAATAASIRDSPMLNEADVGIFTGAYLSKEDGDIVLLNKKFSEIPEIIKLGRRVCENLEKFIQLQLTMEISAFTINIISAAVYSEEKLSSFQVLWVSVIMDILGALGMAIMTIHTQSSRIARVDPKKVCGSGAVITRRMCRIIAVQSFFQVVIILILGMKGKAIFQVKGSVLRVMTFNCYAFCQVFLLIAAVEWKRNGVVSGLFKSKNFLFLCIAAFIGIVQVAAVEVMGVVAHWSKLGIKEWCICVGIASLSVPLSCAASWIWPTKK